MPLLRGELPRLREPVGGHQPLAFRQIHFADKPVQMLNQRLHDLAKPWREACFPAFQGKTREIFLGGVLHGILRKLAPPSIPWHCGWQSPESYQQERRTRPTLSRPSTR